VQNWKKSFSVLVNAASIAPAATMAPIPAITPVFRGGFIGRAFFPAERLSDGRRVIVES
jgi:hypothetical protein